jgi:hypothetical protein
MKQDLDDDGVKEIHPTVGRVIVTFIVGGFAAVLTYWWAWGLAHSMSWGVQVDDSGKAVALPWYVATGVAALLWWFCVEALRGVWKKPS